jgi:hypothetical protein
MNIHLKTLPPHWRYLVSTRQIKEIITNTRADVRIVEFAGTDGKGGRPLAYCWCAGSLESHVVDRHWCFRFCFQGLPEDTLALATEDLSALVVSDIYKFLSVHDELGGPTASASEYFFLRVEDNSLHPSFHVSVFPAGKKQWGHNQWWQLSSE